jgi:hypothetical protein
MFDMKRLFTTLILTLVLTAGTLAAQSPAAETSATFAGKTVRIKYNAPSVRGRKIFGAGGLLSSDPTYPAWRAGANSATSFHTDVDLDINGLAVPKGDYTLYAWVADPDNWLLIVNKQTGQWGLQYDAKQDVGRAKMTMSKPSALIETYKMTLRSDGPAVGTLRMEWENHIATVNFKVK